MRRRTSLIILAVILLIAGLIFVTISVSPVARTQILVNSLVRVDANTTDTSYGVPASYFLNGNSNGKMNGTLLTLQECCIDFYIFNSTAWSHFMSDGYNATNSTNSPVLTVNSSAIDSRNGISATFTFIPEPTQVYDLVFFNANRSLWNTNSTVVFSVIADIDLFYSQAPAKSLIYPGVALIIAGVALIFVRTRYNR